MKKIIAIIAVLCPLAGGTYLLLRADTIPLPKSITAFDADDICSDDPTSSYETDFYEPSGAVYHPDLDRTLVVSDRHNNISYWAKFKIDTSSAPPALVLDGSWTTITGNPDAEGITYRKGVDDEETDPTFFILREGNSGSSTDRGGIIAATWPSTFTSHNLADCDDEDDIVGTTSNGYGLESITFVPDDEWETGTCFEDECLGGAWAGKSCEDITDCKGSRRGSGGLFILGHQGNGKIYIIDLDHDNSTTDCAVAGAYGPYKVGGTTRSGWLAGLDWVQDRGELWLMYHTNSARIAQTTDLTPEGNPEVDSYCEGVAHYQEGIAVNPSDCTGGTANIWIAWDDNVNQGVEVWINTEYTCP